MVDPGSEGRGCYGNQGSRLGGGLQGGSGCESRVGAEFKIIQVGIPTCVSTADFVSVTHSSLCLKCGVRDKRSLLFPTSSMFTHENFQWHGPKFEKVALGFEGTTHRAVSRLGSTQAVVTGDEMYCGSSCAVSSGLRRASVVVPSCAVPIASLCVCDYRRMNTIAV